LAGIIPIVTYLTLPVPLGIIVSPIIVGAIVGLFLVRYRSRRTRVHWRTTLAETAVIIAIAVIASLIIGRV
jgi:VIT1/CCC1 family predicted Fe2+/Mn2+ transporter